jgi:hypothetical protein
LSRLDKIKTKEFVMNKDDSEFLSGLNTRKTLKIIKEKPRMIVENNFEKDKILDWQKWLRHTAPTREIRVNESIIESEEQTQVRKLNNF